MFGAPNKPKLLAGNSVIFVEFEFVIFEEGKDSSKSDDGKANTDEVGSWQVVFGYKLSSSLYNGLVLYKNQK